MKRVRGECDFEESMFDIITLDCIIFKSLNTKEHSFSSQQGTFLEIIMYAEDNTNVKAT